MKKFRTFIVEDEEGPLIRLKSLLLEYASNVIDMDTLCIARSFSEAEDILLSGKKFDLSILDKNLGNGRKTGLHLVTKENRSSFGIVTLTSQDPDSHKQFLDISPAGGYEVIGKPYNKEDILGLVNHLRNIERSASGKLSESPPVWLKEATREFPIEQHNIVYIEVTNHVSIVNYLDEQVLKKSPQGKALAHYEEILSSREFMRISDKHFVNLKFIKEFDGDSIILKPLSIRKGLPADVKPEKIKLPVPQRNRAELKSRFIH